MRAKKRGRESFSRSLVIGSNAASNREKDSRPPSKKHAMRRQLAGSRPIVTGASSGIGWEIALELARQQARLVITARRGDRLTELAAEIEKLGGEAHTVPGDITDAGLRRRLLETAAERLDGLDLLVNNAGIGA